MISRIENCIQSGLQLVLFLADFRLFFYHFCELSRTAEKISDKKWRGVGWLDSRDVFYLRRIRFTLKRWRKITSQQCYNSDARMYCQLNKLYAREKYSRFMNWQHKTIITIEMFQWINYSWLINCLLTFKNWKHDFKILLRFWSSRFTN